jgi:TPR repeat protein
VWRQHKEQCKKAAEVIASLNRQSIDDLDAQFASYKRDAEAGDADSQYDLGICYSNGSGVAADKAQAVKWFKRAADAGDADALKILQSM